MKTRSSQTIATSPPSLFLSFYLLFSRCLVFLASFSAPICRLLALFSVRWSADRANDRPVLTLLSLLLFFVLFCFFPVLQSNHFSPNSDQNATCSYVQIFSASSWMLVSTSSSSWFAWAKNWLIAQLHGQFLIRFSNQFWKLIISFTNFSSNFSHFCCCSCCLFLINLFWFSLLHSIFTDQFWQTFR